MANPPNTWGLKQQLVAIPTVVRVGWAQLGGLGLSSGVTGGTLFWKLHWAGTLTLSLTHIASNVYRLSSGSSRGLSTGSLSFPLYGPSAGLELLMA